MKARIVVGEGSCGLAAGAGAVHAALEAKLTADVNATLGITGCVGICYLEPIVDVYDENGKQSGSKTIWYNDDGGYDVSINDLDYNTVYTEYYNDRDELTKRTEYLYDANGELWFSADTRAEVREELMQIA